MDYISLRALCLPRRLVTAPGQTLYDSFPNPLSHARRGQDKPSKREGADQVVLRTSETITFLLASHARKPGFASTRTGHPQCVGLGYLQLVGSFLAPSLICRTLQPLGLKPPSSIHLFSFFPCVLHFLPWLPDIVLYLWLGVLTDNLIQVCPISCFAHMPVFSHPRFHGLSSSSAPLSTFPSTRHLDSRGSKLTFYS